MFCFQYFSSTEMWSLRILNVSECPSFYLSVSTTSSTGCALYVKLLRNESGIQGAASGVCFIEWLCYRPHVPALEHRYAWLWVKPEKGVSYYWRTKYAVPMGEPSRGMWLFETETRVPMLPWFSNLNQISEVDQNISEVIYSKQMEQAVSLTSLL